MANSTCIELINITTLLEKHAAYKSLTSYSVLEKHFMTPEIKNLSRNKYILKYPTSMVTIFVKSVP